MIAVEVRRTTLNTHDPHMIAVEEEEEEEAEDKADIKSNNPHLTGGEQNYKTEISNKFKKISFIIIYKYQIIYQINI